MYRILATGKYLVGISIAMYSIRKQNKFEKVYFLLVLCIAIM